MSQEQHQNSLQVALRKDLPRILPDFLVRQRWFGGKARTIESAEVLDTLRIPFRGRTAFLILTRLKYAEGNGETYALPLVERESSPATTLDEAANSKSSLKLDVEGKGTTFSDAFLDKEFAVALYEAILGGKSFKGSAGELSAHPSSRFRSAEGAKGAVPEPSLMKAEQSNTSVRYGERYILKFFRRLEQGMNPDVEIGAFLTDKASFEHSPPVRGTLEYRNPQARTCALGILQDFVSNKGDAWLYTLGTLEDYLKGVASNDAPFPPALPGCSISDSAGLEIPEDVPTRIGSFWESAGLLGRRTGQLHVALASDSADPNFRPEPFSADFQRTQCDSMRGLTQQVLRVLEKRVASLPDSIRGDAARILEREKDLLARFESFANQELTVDCIRIHGDYHLGQVLYTGSDFVIIDFEGEPARPLEERRKKRCALQDVAGMLRSFHYAADTAFHGRASKTDASPHGEAKLPAWKEYWRWWVSVRFLKEYLSVAASARFLPSSKDEFAVLLEAYLLEKAVYELGYELNNRPDWVRLPIQGILQLMKS